MAIVAGHLLLISVVGGLVSPRRPRVAARNQRFPTFVAAHGFDADVYATQPVPKLAKLPGVISAAEVIGADSMANRRATAPTRSTRRTSASSCASPRAGDRFSKLVSGQLPDPSAPDQVLAIVHPPTGHGVHLGTVIHVPFYAASQASAYNDAIGAPPKPKGPTVAFRVVGFEATEFEFPSGATPIYDLYATQRSRAP